MRNIKGGALLYFHSPHDSYSGPHLHIVVVLHPPPTPSSIAEKQTQATNYCTERAPVGVHGGLWGGKSKKAIGAECVEICWGWGCRGVPPVMSMSHHPHSAWASDITAALSEEERNSPQMSFTADGWGSRGLIAKQIMHHISEACTQDLRCAIIRRQMCVCVQQSVCDIRLTDSEGNCSCREKDWFRGRLTSCPDQASGHPITTSPFLSRSLCVSAVGLFMPSGLGDPAGT